MKKYIPVFVGGTGRSGTTILSKVLGVHPNVYRFPFETRFIFDPDGVIDLISAFNDNWDPFRGDKSTKKFIELMSCLGRSNTFYLYLRGLLNYLSISSFRYSGVGLINLVGKRKYNEILEKFMNRIVIEDYTGIWFGTDPMKFKPKINITKRIEYEDMLAIIEEFINDLFFEIAEKNNASHVVDHTPFSFLHAGALSDILPNCKIIHIHRDIRDVVCSYKRKNWGADSVKKNLIWLINVFEKWEYEKKKLKDNSYLEVKFENFVNDSYNEIKKICDFLDLDFSANMMSIDLSKNNIGRWEEELDSEDIELIDMMLNKEQKNKYLCK